MYDTYKQMWYSDINNSGRLHSYAIYNHDFDSERYLRVVPEGKYRNALCRFRASSHITYIFKSLKQEDMKT